MPIWKRKRGERKDENKDPFENMFGDFFGDDFLQALESMREDMERSFRGNEELFERLRKEQPRALKPGQPMVYGFSINIRPGGKVNIEEFGNVKPEEKKISDEREPLVDVIDKEKSITVLAELPGVEEKDIKVSIKGKELVVDVPNKFRKKLALPAKARLNKKNYKNGVLELDLIKE